MHANWQRDRPMVASASHRSTCSDWLHGQCRLWHWWCCQRGETFATIRCRRTPAADDRWRDCSLPDRLATKVAGLQQLSTVNKFHTPVTIKIVYGPKCQTPVHGHRLQTCCTTPPTDELTTILQLAVQQIHHQRTKKFATSQHLDMSRCWALALGCGKFVVQQVVELLWARRWWWCTWTTSP